MTSPIRPDFAPTSPRGEDRTAQTTSPRAPLCIGAKSLGRSRKPRERFDLAPRFKTLDRFKPFNQLALDVGKVWRAWSAPIVTAGHRAATYTPSLARIVVDDEGTRIYCPTWGRDALQAGGIDMTWCKRAGAWLIDDLDTYDAFSILERTGHLIRTHHADDTPAALVVGRQEQLARLRRRRANVDTLRRLGYGGTQR